MLNARVRQVNSSRKHDKVTSAAHCYWCHTQDLHIQTAVVCETLQGHVAKQRLGGFDYVIIIITLHSWERHLKFPLLEVIICLRRCRQSCPTTTSDLQ
jgi:hypothetical protein